MKQFTFTSQLAPIIWKYLESRQNEGYTSVHCGYYMQELDCLSKELSDAPVVTKELIDAWDLLKPFEIFLGMQTSLQQRFTLASMQR